MVYQCVYYNGTETNCKGSYSECATQVECSEIGHCFSVWQFDNNSTNKPLNAGCNPPGLASNNECMGGQCIGQQKGPVNYYCCCKGNLCNANFTMPAQKQEDINKPHHIDRRIEAHSTNHVIPIVLILTLVGAYIYWSSRRTNENHHSISNSRRIINNNNNNYLDNNDHSQQLTLINHPHHHDNVDNSNKQQNDIRIDLRNIKLLEIVGSGRFGTVHRASLDELDNKEIAVKIIPSIEHQSWLNEQQIHNSPKVKHPNILNFIYSDEHLETESYWLVVDYAPKGSLYSFLKDNVITWREFLHIALGIVRGLSHLHEADIAHRDFKSKNVLLKNDLTPCISDFGVAAILDTSTGSQLDHRKKYLQVGTPRYMAPEVLECSVTFTKASFTKIDVYALSLVLWELISRCKSVLGEVADEPPPYKLPFEDLAGPSPDINKMREIVVVEKLRPPLRDEWRKYASEFCRAIEDGWEYDHDARISASCFVERIESLPKL